MKKSKLKGYIKDWENKNKKFSYAKTMKLLDVINYIFLDSIKKINYKSNYEKSKYIMQEIVYDFDVVMEFLNKGRILLSINILRNVYENMLYVMATSYNSDLIVDIKTNPSDFRDVVKDNCNNILTDNFEPNDISDIYNHLSKLTHVINLKEAVSYLLSKKKYQNYISNEIKGLLLIIEYMYLEFLNKKTNEINDEFIYNSIIIANHINQINVLYYIANTEKESIILNSYFYGEKNQNYLNKCQNELLDTFKDYKIYKKDIEITLKKTIKKFNQQVKEYNYFEIANKIIES